MIRTMFFRNKVARIAAPILLGCVMGAGGWMLPAAERDREPGLAVSAAAGIFRADQASFRTLYGNGVFDGSFEFRVRLGAGIWAVTGYRVLRVEGATTVVGTSFDDESYTLAFNMSVLRAGLRYGHVFGRIVAFGGAGACFNRYEEEWTKIPGLGETGKVASWYAELGGEFLLNRTLSFFLRGEYSPIPTSRGAALEPDVDLGGLDFSAGLAVRFRP